MDTSRRTEGCVDDTRSCPGLGIAMPTYGDAQACGRQGEQTWKDTSLQLSAFVSPERAVGKGAGPGSPPSKPRGVPRARPPATGPGCPFKRPQRRVNRCAWLLPSPPLPQRCDSGRRRSRAARWAAAGSRCRAEGAPAGPPGARVPSGSAAELAAGRAAASAAPRGSSGERVRPEDSTIAGRRRQGKGQGERRREKEKAQHGGWRGEDGAEDSRAWLR